MAETPHPFKKMVDTKVFNMGDVPEMPYGATGHHAHGGSLLCLVGPRDYCPAYGLVVRVQKIRPGAVQLYHYHEVREQVMICLEGTGTMLIEGKEYPISKDDVFFTPPFVNHRTVNTSDKELRMLIIDAPHQKERTHNFDEEELKKGNLVEIEV